MTMIKAGTTSVVRYFKMRLVADGKAATGLTVTTFDLQYTRELTAASTKIDGIVGTGGATTYIANKVFEIDAADSPGLYMVCFPNAAFAAGVDQVILDLTYDDTVYAESQNVELIIETYKYLGEKGYGIFINDDAANTDVILGIDGTYDNPVSTLAAARTLADALGTKRYYIEDSDLTLAATHVDWDFIGEGEFLTNIINFDSQDVSRSHFHNLTLEGTQGGSGRIFADRCALQDPGAGVSTFHIHAVHCGLVDDITVDTSEDNVFEHWYSLVAGTSAPIVRASGASGTMAFRHGSGGLELAGLSASHNVSVGTDGQVIFNADCNVNATVALYGIMDYTDNTGGMTNISQNGMVNMTKINTEVDTAISDAGLMNADAIRAALGLAAADLDDQFDSAQVDLDLIISYLDTEVADILAAVTSTGVVLSAAQMNSIADHVIRRTAANARASSDGDTINPRSLLGAVSKLVNKIGVVNTNLITYEEDDVTAFLTQAITTDASAEPIKTLDTA